MDSTEYYFMDSAAEDPEKSYFYHKNENDKRVFDTLRPPADNSINIVQKLFNREIWGSTCGLGRGRVRGGGGGGGRRMFERIPPRLRFCLLDIVPRGLLRGHVFMGLSQCGQYLLSFTYSCNTMIFRETSKFTLHFLSWVPGRAVRGVHSVPLFGDEPVDSKLAISMAQWRHNPRVIVVYGIADSCSERSCLSVIGVPRLGCKQCAAYSRNEEDDCISGYHVALHLTAHGAGYAPLQAVGAGAWDRICNNLGSPPPLTLRAQQRSLDTELLCNEVCGRLCKLNGKKFIYCFDWGCHVIDTCQSSGCLSGLCAMWLWASAEEGGGGGAKGGGGEAECDACSHAGAGCLLHRKQYAAECLFVWDLVSGVYRTERVSMTEDSSQEGNRMSGADRARELAKRLGPLPCPPGNENRLLTAVTGRSLHKLTDVDNCIEITKNHPDSSESESEAEEDSDSD